MARAASRAWAAVGLGGWGLGMGSLSSAQTLVARGDAAAAWGIMANVFEDAQEQAEANDLRDGFGSELTASGFALLQQVRRQAVCLQKQSSFGWAFEAARLPIPGMGPNACADLILQSFDDRSLMVARCVWSDPEALGWCFARGGPVHASQDHQRYVFDQVQYRVPNVEVLTKAMLDNAFQISTRLGPAIDEQAYQWGFALGSRRGQVPEDGPAQRAAVLGPMGEACRYHNGLINHFDRSRQLLGQRDALDVLPVVITNARLWVHQDPAVRLDPHSGRVAIDPTQLSEIGWLLFQHHQDEQHKHAARRAAYPDRLSTLLEYDYLRTVAVVHAAQFEPFVEALNGLRADGWGA